MRAAALSYEIRSPEQSLLYGVVAGELETYLCEQQSAGHDVPRFVEEEFRAFLDCGVLCRGLLRLHCGGCGLDRVVGFSCKKKRLVSLVWRAADGPDRKGLGVPEFLPEGKGTIRSTRTDSKIEKASSRP